MLSIVYNIMSYNQHKLDKNNQNMMDCELPLGMIHVSLIFDHNMGMKYAEGPFKFFLNGYIFRPSTHTSGHSYT